jgi:hypothetical protein
MNDLPVPTSEGTVAVPAPGPSPQRWAGAPSAVLEPDGSWILAYRVRYGDERGDANVIARSDDGEHFETLGTLDRSRYGAAMVERPALVHLGSGGWRMWISCATPNSKHWWIGLLEADTPEGLIEAELKPAFPGDARTAVKDPLVRFVDGEWHAWVCCHPLDVAGEEDRMTTAHARSRDGLTWDWYGTVLAGRAGAWDQRGARLTSFLPDGRAFYDGRRTKDENWFERIGLAIPGDRPNELIPVGDDALFDARYLEVVPLPGGGNRIFYEYRLPDESHELRTEIVTTHDPAG